MSQGYTIIEVMIVLAVTGALFMAAMLMLSGQQGKAQFNEAIRDLDSKIRDNMNDVSTGNYGINTNIACTTSANGPVITSFVSDTQGTNEDCVFIGRAFNFTDTNQARIYPIVGLRRPSGGSTEASNVSESQPRALAPTGGTDTTPNGSETYNLKGGISIAWVRYNLGGVDQSISTIAFLGEQAGYSGGLIESKATNNVNIVPVQASLLTDGSQAAAAKISAIKNNLTGGVPTGQNPPTGVTVCVNGGSSQYALIRIGGENRTVGTFVEIIPGSCPA